MNTPPKPKPPKRIDTLGLDVKLPDGELRMGLLDPDLAQIIGRIVGQWTHAEEAMSMLLAAIAGISESAGRNAFRSILNQHARITVMRNLLEKSHEAVSLGPEYDAFLDEFEKLNGLRNQYLHSVWLTDDRTGKVYLIEAETTHFAHLDPRRITAKELTAVEDRIISLRQSVIDHAHARRDRIAAERYQASRKTRPRRRGGNG